MALPEALPDPALVVLAGPSGSGKSAWAAQRYRPHEVVSSDRLRAVVGSGEHDLDASADAFALLDQIVATLRRHCLAVGREPAQVEITVLDIPVIGRDREHAGAIVEKLRGRTAASAFARRHHAGTPDDHIGRYRLLAERGVRTVFVSLPDLARPDDVLRLAPVAAAFA